jgi:hypothetical protein
VFLTTYDRNHVAGLTLKGGDYAIPTWVTHLHKLFYGAKRQKDEKKPYRLNLEAKMMTFSPCTR